MHKLRVNRLEGGQWLKIIGLSLVVTGALLIAPRFPAPVEQYIWYWGGVIMGWGANDLRVFFGRMTEPCPDCKGEKTYLQPDPSWRGAGVMNRLTTCPTCKGTGVKDAC